MGYWINRMDGLLPPLEVIHEQVVVIPAQGYLSVTNAARKALFVLSGECRHQILGEKGPNRDVHLRPGDILTIPSLCEQHYLSSQEGKAGRIHVVRVAFDADRIPPLPQRKPTAEMPEPDARADFDGMVARCMNEVIYLPKGAESDSALAETLQEMREEARLRRPEYSLRVSGLCLSLLVLLTRQIQATWSVPGTRDQAVQSRVPAAEFHARQIKSYLHQHLSHPLRLSQIAEHVCLSEEHTARMFKKVTGMTLFDYGRRLRITEAKNLLASTELNVSEIAVQSGFASLTVFSRNFKRETGITPSEFRQQIARQMG